MALNFVQGVLLLVILIIPISVNATQSLGLLNALRGSRHTRFHLNAVSVLFIQSVVLVHLLTVTNGLRQTCLI